MVDVIEIIHFSSAEIKVIFPVFERRPVEISGLDINVCARPGEPRGCRE